MPKILINEKDRTSPGTPDGYANFSVLVAGFAAANVATDSEMYENRAKKRDSNGVYEFTSAEDFKETIGLVAPKQTISFSGGSKDIYHYGNQMAYELLNMGYTVVYKPISANTIGDLGEESFWADFRDKASYDFRFITHGLLESTIIADEDDAAELADAQTELINVEAAIAQLELIEKRYPLDAAADADEQAEVSAARNTAYSAIMADFPGFDTEGSLGHYETFSAAYDALIGTATTDGKKKELEDTIAGITGGSITTALINKANACIANLAKYTATGAKDANGDETNDMYMKEIPGRGDCVALIEADENKYTPTTGIQANPELSIISAINEMTGIDASNGKFCAMTVPSVHYKMSIDAENPNEFDNNVKFPGAFHYLACFMNSLRLGFAEWYAAAGYTRGVASYIVDHTSVKLGEIAINALEPRNWNDPQSDYPKFACNVIANFRGSYYLWGNRTAHPLGKKGSLDTGDLVASSFLNIRQLCCTIKKQLYVACRTFTFDPNSDTLWVNFCNAIRPTLEAMKADQGIRDYKIMKMYTDKKATLKAKLRIIPIEAVEDFDLEVSLEDSFGETAAVVTE